jgi:hypothetical protein
MGGNKRSVKLRARVPEAKNANFGMTESLL